MTGLPPPPCDFWILIPGLRPTNSAPDVGRRLEISLTEIIFTFSAIFERFVAFLATESMTSSKVSFSA